MSVFVPCPVSVSMLHRTPTTNHTTWEKRNSSNPPSKSLLLWRLFHNKLPTDENLSNRGLNMSSVCNLRFKQSKTFQHLIFDCTYAMNIWRCLSNVLNSPSTISSLDDVLVALNKSYSPQCKTVVLSAVINTVNSIWFARNQIRFNISKIHWRSSISSIMAQVNLSDI